MDQNGLVTVDQNSPMADIVANGGTMQQTRSSYTAAVSVQRPRNLKKTHDNLMQEAQLAGESFYYGWGAGENKIEGPSVDLAMAALRHYGNCAVELAPVQDLHDSWIFTAFFIDLENGVTIPRQFRQSKNWVVYGKMDPERKMDVRFQIGQSKAIRNVILNAVPKFLIDHALAMAKSGVKDKIEKYVADKGLPAAVDLVLRSLAKQGVKEDRILAKFQVADKKALTIENLVILRGDLSALEAGRERASDLFPEAPAGKAAEEKLKPQPQTPPATQSTIVDREPGVETE